MFYDIHCHILPGIDDGARDIDESIQMSRLAAQDQIEIAVATPHHIPRSNLSGKDEINKMVSKILKNKVGVLENRLARLVSFSLSSSFFNQ